MYKPAHGAAGELVSPVGYVDTTLLVDMVLASKLATILGTGLGNHTYVAIQEVGVIEIVKVLSADYIGILTVERAKDGTLSSPFAAGAAVYYILTADAVGDMINDRLTSLGGVDTLNFFINDPHTVVKSGSDVTINIHPLDVTSPDGSIDVTGDNNSIGISVQRGAFGCCDD